MWSKSDSGCLGDSIPGQELTAYSGICRETFQTEGANRSLQILQIESIVLLVIQADIDIGYRPDRITQWRLLPRHSAGKIIRPFTHKALYSLPGKQVANPQILSGDGIQ